MKAKYIYDGQAIDYIPSEAIPAGSVVIQGSLIGITKLDISAGELGAIHTRGVFEIEKATGAIEIGDKIYWAAGTKNVTTTATSNTLIGVAVNAAASADTTVLVKIG
jgi:predicted RecA/RadA family phage recombinase